MRKLLTILLLIPIIAFGQGINTREDLNKAACAFTGVSNYDTNYFISTSALDLPYQSKRLFVFDTTFNNVYEDSYSENSTYWAGNNPVLIDSVVYLATSLSNDGLDSSIIYLIDIKNQTVLSKQSHILTNVTTYRSHAAVLANNAIYSFGGIAKTDNIYKLSGHFISFNLQGDSIGFKEYVNPSLNLEFSSAVSLSNGHILVGGRKFDWMFPEHDDDIHHTYIMEVDSAGNIQWEWTDPENWTYMPYSISNTSDGGVIMGRTKAVVNQTGGNDSRCVITKLSDLHEIEWEYPIGEYTESIGVMVNSITGVDKVNDTTFVFSGTYNSWGAVDGFLIKITESGNVLWRREFRPEIEAQQPQTTVLYDMTPTSDGGYVMVGESRDPEGDGANQQGWLVKTNCLGYFAPPSASCYAGNADNFEMVFYNNSLNGGEFEWDFGDGQSFTSGEGDTVNHTYAGAGPYNVRLIAKGCNGEADTIYFDVNPSVASIEEVKEHGEGTFDIYPNPASDRVYVSINMPFESLPSATSGRTLEIVDINGKVHQTIPVYKNTYTQEVNISSLPKGIYFVNLFNDKGVIKSRKLVVQWVFKFGV